MDGERLVMMIILTVIFIAVCVAVSVAISRWVFRVNDIVDRLDTIINALKVGLPIEEEKK
ncbi:MAG: hypothetical protein LLG40_04195 [Deltaproteobacteria bacterium]|nr:hypothetical protein [Deltaproteobacteria bacterium]